MGASTALSLSPKKRASKLVWTCLGQDHVVGSLID